MTPKMTLSESRLAEILDLRFATFEKAISEHFITDARAREIVRDELGLASKQRWTFRSSMAALGMLLISLSTFVLTAFHGWGGKGH